MKFLVARTRYNNNPPVLARTGQIQKSIKKIRGFLILGYLFIAMVLGGSATPVAGTFGNCNYQVCENSLIESGSFEYCMQGWSLGSTTGYNYDSNYDMHGSYNFFIVPYPYHNDYASISQTVEAHPGEEFTLSFYAGVHNTLHNQEVALQFLDAKGAVLDESLVEIDFDVTGRYRLESYNLSGTAPVGTVSARVLGSVQKAAGYSYAYLKLDGVCLTKIDGGGGSLPVDWLGFEATKRDFDAYLSWQTAMEQNAAYYEIERSFDAETFEKIAEVVAVGNTQDISDYSFTDKRVAKSISSPVYYRLRQVDMDGTSSYSHLVSVEFHDQKTFDLSMSLYPNPTREFAWVTLEEGTAIRKINILNSLGEKMRIPQTKGQGGFSLDLSSLTPGYYFTEVITEDGQKVVETLVVTK